MAILPVLAAAAFALPAPGETLLVSRADGAGGAKADISSALDGSSGGGISRDGRYVAFSSDGENLVRGDDNEVSDIFVRDLATHRNVLVTRADGRRGEQGHSHSSEPALSADGRSVAFTTQANNLYPSAPDSYFPVLVRDLRRGRTLYASRASGARGAGANDSSYEPAISGDGTRVAFHSDATNLHPDDRSRRPDVYVRDLRSHRTLLVSRAAGARGEHGNRRSEHASISGDGRRVAFDSTATNLHPDDGDGTRDVFVRDLRTHRLLLVSGDQDGASSRPHISSDGRFVTFVVGGGVVLHELRTGATTLVAADGDAPRVSADGRYVAFDSSAADVDPADTDGAWDVFVRDMAAGVTRLASRATGGAKAGGHADVVSTLAGIAADGSVLFDSSATNLDPDDGDDLTDVFVHGGP